MTLRAHGICHTFGPRRILDDIDMNIAGGSAVALLGASGSGKSTLVRILNGLVRPASGCVTLDGAPLVDDRGRPDIMLLRRMSLVQQRPGLLDLTVLANVAFPLRVRGAARARAELAAQEALARVGLSHLEDTHAASISGGEAQRVALARALTTAPDVLLLDEATNQLDPAHARRVESILAEERKRGCAILLVTHNPAQARRVATEVALLHDARIVEAGAVGILDDPRSEALRDHIAYG